MKNIKNLELLLRALLTIVFWLVLLVIVGAATLITNWADVAMPTLGYTLPLLFGLFVTFIILNKHGWEVIKTEILERISGEISVKLSEQLRELSDEELVEALTKIDEAKREFGLTQPDEIEKRKKAKRDDISERIKALSDSDLLHVKAQLETDSLDDDEIIHLLDTIDIEKQRD